jgi:hypothetical protein
MKSSLTRILLVLFFISNLSFMIAYSQTDSSKYENYMKSPELLVAELYRSVTFNPGQRPDWEKVRRMFLDSAIVFLRTTRTTTAVFNVDGFIDDFVKFIERTPAKDKGFGERILKMKPYIAGEMATILILYDAQIYGINRPPQQGLDFWQLIKKDNRWWIISITNEVISKTVQIPDELK